jgi:transposase InsO family protein
MNQIADHRRHAFPKGWKKSIKSGMIGAISLGRYVAGQTRGEAAEQADPKVRCRAEREQLHEEASLLAEEMRIKDTRWAAVPPHQRPRYAPRERLAILELRAARGWSLEQTARRFFVTAETISSWQKRSDERGPQAIVQLPRPVSKFPDLVTHLVQRLKVLCPALGKRKIAAKLARAGLHLSASSVARMLARPPVPKPAPVKPENDAQPKRLVTATRPNHVWHVDMTAVPIGGGFWCSWLPFALPQRWPFCWWVAVVVDHFSRRVLGTATFYCQPSSKSVRCFLGRMIAKTGAAPRYIVCDRGKQFDCDGFRAYCKDNEIKPPRYGALGQHGSIAVVERCIRTLKESLRRLPVIPLSRRSAQRELDLIAGWYNEHRPHETLGGCTPNEVFYNRLPANRRPRYESRKRWPRGSPCAQPWALVRGRPGARLELELTHHGGRRHLPIVTLRRVA